MVRGRKAKDLTGTEILENTEPMEDISVDIMADENSNGHSSPLSAVPSQSDILVSMGQGSPNLAITMITGSEDPKDYVVRGRMTMKEILYIQSMIAWHNTVRHGSMDLMGVIGWRFNASAGINGKAREEAVKIGTAISRMQMMRRQFGGMFNRFRGDAGG
ncbi:MAG: hypothetical protein ACREQA_20625 [Candidatus Binatia bacterium]